MGMHALAYSNDVLLIGRLRGLRQDGARGNLGAGEQVPAGKDGDPGADGWLQRASPLHGNQQGQWCYCFWRALLLIRAFSIDFL
jgi:hypothetical protein